MVELSQKIQIAKIIAKDKVYKVQEKWQTSNSGKNSLTKDPAYNAANPKHFIPMMDESLNVIKDEIGWTSGGLSGSYSLKNNSIRINSGLDYMTNGKSDDSVQILGFKIGADWDLLNNLVFSLKSNIRFNRIKGNENDGIDNDNDGKIDGKSEIWSTSNSGTVISLNYRF